MRKAIDLYQGCNIILVAQDREYTAILRYQLELIVCQQKILDGDVLKKWAESCSNVRVVSKGKLLRLSFVG
jgi:hypothetical protein